VAHPLFARRSPRGPASYHLIRPRWQRTMRGRRSQCLRRTLTLYSEVQRLILTSSNYLCRSDIRLLTGRLLKHARLVPRASFFYGLTIVARGLPPISATPGNSLQASGICCCTGRTNVHLPLPACEAPRVSSPAEARGLFTSPLGLGAPAKCATPRRARPSRGSTMR
jgi:hypothetical protein